MASDLPAPPTEGNVYPADRIKKPRWLTWKEADDGRKIPRAPYNNPGNHDQYVSAQDPTIWTTFEEATDWTEKLTQHQLAHVIPNRDDYPETDLVLVDYDDARNPHTGEIHPAVHEHLQQADSYADVSPSGTGVHILCRGALPEDVKTITDDLPDHAAFPDAEIEVYDSGRYLSTTGIHISDTPDETRPAQDFIDALVDDYATVSEAVPDAAVSEPTTSREDLDDLDTTSDMEDIFDAIKHVRPQDIHLDSPVTEERTDGSKSRDPTWANSKTGTRLAELDDGWVYRDGLIGLDALQVVALEEHIITDETDYPKGDAFWDAVDALRERGAHIPEYEPDDEDDDDDQISVPNPQAMSASDWTDSDPGDQFETIRPGDRPAASERQSSPSPPEPTSEAPSAATTTSSENSTGESTSPANSTASATTSESASPSSDSTKAVHQSADAPVAEPSTDSQTHPDEESIPAGNGSETVSPDSESATVQELEAEIDDLMDRIETLERVVDVANNHIADLQAELRDEREKREELEAENRDLHHALKTDPEITALLNSLDTPTLRDQLDDDTLARLLLEVAEDHADADGTIDLTELTDATGPLARLASFLRSR